MISLGIPDNVTILSFLQGEKIEANYNTTNYNKVKFMMLYTHHFWLNWRCIMVLLLYFDETRNVM